MKRLSRRSCRKKSMLHSSMHLRIGWWLLLNGCTPPDWGVAGKVESIAVSAVWRVLLSDGFGKPLLEDIKEWKTSKRVMKIPTSAAVGIRDAAVWFCS
jgi:hypothetical protein